MKTQTRSWPPMRKKRQGQSREADMSFPQISPWAEAQRVPLGMVKGEVAGMWLPCPDREGGENFSLKISITFSSS